MKPHSPIFLPDVAQCRNDPTCGVLLGVSQEPGARGRIWLRIVGPVGITVGAVVVNHSDLEVAVQRLYELIPEAEDESNSTH